MCGTACVARICMHQVSRLSIPTTTLKAMRFSPAETASQRLANISSTLAIPDTIQSDLRGAQQPPPPCLFLQLPAELRCLIYAYCTPTTSPISSFIGILSTNKQIKSEFEVEALAHISKLLVSIKTSFRLNNAADIILKPPKTLSALQFVKIQLPRSIYLPAPGVFQENDYETYSIHQIYNTKLDQCLAPLFSLHLKKLTITFYKDKPKPSQKNKNKDRRNNLPPNFNFSTRPKGLFFDLATTLLFPSPPLWKLSSATLASREMDLYPIRQFHLIAPLNAKRISLHWGWDKDKDELAKPCQEFWTRECEFWKAEERAVGRRWRRWESYGFGREGTGVWFLIG
ncbi:hypothetical protein P154DRAFT_567716 [Amniculicola lignicola CBS 123094]|uniref:Uncharacterized protein n=1 Tax=Amniculicola lignicola CBS 123094 TaxID=1392246 RepID=A0A6A5VWW6_9PLEO|nr:hypothetical protein P154DRAFT_567716 [Amniculicola lignicola CBS 123094]